MTAALCLERAGHDVCVFEQRAEGNQTGAGIQLSPNAVRIYRKLDLEQALLRHACQSKQAIIADYRTGKTLLTVALNNQDVGYLHIDRRRLLEVLSEAAVKRGIDTRYASPVTQFKTAGASVRLKFANNRTHHADLVIGADGIHSSVRRYLFGNQQPQFTGMVAWRGLIDASSVSSDCIARLESNASIWVGPGLHVVAYPLDSGRTINFVGVSKQREWSKDSWVSESSPDELRAKFSAAAQPVSELVNACTECYQWGLFARPPLQRWWRGRTVLLGDACHPMLPFMAQGAAMAIEDADALAQTLAEHESLAIALGEYQLRRHNRTARVARMSRRAGSVYHMSGVLRVARNAGFGIVRAMPRVVTQSFDQLYAHNSDHQVK